MKWGSPPRTSSIGSRALGHADFLRRLAKCKSRKSARELFNSASSDQLLAIVEIALNLVRDRYLLSPIARRKLRCYSRDINTLARKRSDTTARQWCLNNAPQSGRGVPALLASVLVPIIAEKLISYLRNKN